MTRCMAKDLGEFNIRVNIVCPGSIDTPAFRRAHPEFTKEAQIAEYAKKKHFLPRIGTGEDVANAIIFFASDESSFITGASLMVVQILSFS